MALSAFVLAGTNAHADGEVAVVAHPFAADGEYARLGPTVGELVAAQWAGRGHRRVIRSEIACPDAACGAQDARSVGAAEALIGRVYAFGNRLTVSASWVAADGTVKSSAMTSVASEAELPEAVQRLATDLDKSSAGLTEGAPSTAPGTSPSGSVPAAAGSGAPSIASPDGVVPPPPPPTGDATAPHRRVGHTLLRLGGFVPMRGYAPGATALSGEMGAVLDLGTVLLEPRVGLRRSFDEGGAWYLQVPLDFGIFYRIGDDKVFPLLGGGLGLHFLAMHRQVEQKVGTVVWTRHTDSVTDSILGFGAFARVGIGIELPRSVLALFTADYDVTFGKIDNNSFHQGVVLSAGFAL